MAGGIDWFRWHHGSITDPKFQLVASRANARFGDVIAIWAFVLEMASADADRGNVGQLDLETIDHMLGAEAGTAVRVLDAMTKRGLIDGNRVASWDRRQAKRERPDDRSSERVKAFREKKRCNANETPCNANETLETPREEKRREENISTTDVVDKRRVPRFDAQAHLVSLGVDPGVSADWLKLRKTKKADVTLTAIAGIVEESAKAGFTLTDALRECCARGWAGFKAEWLLRDKPDQSVSWQDKKQAAEDATNRAIRDFGNSDPLRLIKEPA